MLSQYDAYVKHPCGIGECKVCRETSNEIVMLFGALPIADRGAATVSQCADIGAGMKRYTEAYCSDMDDLSASHLDTGGHVR